MFPSAIVSASWLADHLDEVRVVDVRWYLDGRSGRAAFDSGHLPGAVFADLDSDLSAPPSAVGGRHPLPDPTAFAAAMSQLGIGDATPVVAYDDAGGAIAARLWWMLHVLGHEVAVLDGGIDAWPGELEITSAEHDEAVFTPMPWPRERFRTADEVADGAYDVLIDARTPDRYRGENTSVDPRPGHVPGAVNAPFPGNLDNGSLRGADELAGRFASIGVGAGDAVVAYCGSGVTACHDLLALEVAGHGPTTALFVGSSSAWAGDPERPLVTGDDPG